MKSALAKYNDLCTMGGSDTFLKLLKGARLESPFKTDVIKRIAFSAAEFLNL